jgi:hypothetical protein
VAPHEPLRAGSDRGGGARRGGAVSASGGRATGADVRPLGQACLVLCRARVGATLRKLISCPGQMPSASRGRLSPEEVNYEGLRTHAHA